MAAGDCAAKTPVSAITVMVAATLSLDLVSVSQDLLGNTANRVSCNFVNMRNLQNQGAEIVFPYN